MIRSISQLLIANVDALLRGESIQPLDLGDAAALIAERDAEVQRAAADRVAAERAEQRQRLAVELKDAALGCFPARAVNAALAIWPSDTSPMRHAREFLQGRKEVLVLAGGPGCGKTSAAAWIALELGGAPGFIRASSLERRGRYSKTLDAWLSSRTALVIDDLGAEVLDGHGVFRSLLDETLDSFYGGHRRLVITTNLLPQRKTADSEPQFVERYGQRVASRLAEVASWANCGSRDLRRDQLKLASDGL